MIAVFDTNIVIDALNGVEAADVEYSRYERVLISRITWIETMVGAKEDAEQVRDFMDRHFEIAPLDEAVAEATITIRRSRHLRLPDAIIWATAQAHGAELVTRNTRDFNPTWGGIRVPYTI
ncbi:MAG: type II toxin-antitoxin system VapC family toxin [Chloroflexi bacterium]|nr:type II toxin-antitoxin system VapC family toxin [Chloroflexota bacterium]